MAISHDNEDINLDSVLRNFAGSLGLRTPKEKLLVPELLDNEMNEFEVNDLKDYASKDKKSVAISQDKVGERSDDSKKIKSKRESHFDEDNAETILRNISLKKTQKVLMFKFYNS